MSSEQLVVSPSSMQSMIDSVQASLESQYLADDRPWVVAFSGGKDSTLVLQLVFNMLLGLGKRATKPIFVLSSDTQVEAPNVAAYVTAAMDTIQRAATALQIPISTILVRPTPAESYWGKLIGKGYPPPSRWFRWCTSNMKIKPSRRAIENITHNHGSVILLLGTRISESSQRGRAMQAREINSRGLNPHHEIPNALVATPIASWSNDDVWEYLSDNPCPWGGNHSYLFSLYRQASGGECPVIFDLNTPSCGGSRFGCWTCTVVKEDKSLQGFIRSGEEHLQPLVDFRDWLIELRDKPGYRSEVKRNGNAGPGPFLPAARQEILEALLALEKQVGLPLVSEAELVYIQHEWSRDFDFQGNSVHDVATKYGRDIAMPGNPQETTHPEDELLEQAAVESGLNPDLMRELLEIRRRDFPSLDKWGAKSRFERAVGDLIKKAAQQVEQTTQA
ncbi:putative sulfurtransferase DndC [Candidatus Propionivibrio aalborgensis]|uniref:Putative sulfurtransferase DndC n=1 Tax=Candidatus Propionivibrio aalborgensis TaxID=1860101 RepID=A0A1A8XN42_9RHOO|nr:DNA phosphorothioation system sulfurtransferase DndC [Candidatus Propionivibrio aalborgensis]SBT05842.1 putative sulfurtransferase DndC [Candidatus Propionivibrio aalborgensis]